MILSFNLSNSFELMDFMLIFMVSFFSLEPELHEFKRSSRLKAKSHRFMLTFQWSHISPFTNIELSSRILLYFQLLSYKKFKIISINIFSFSKFWSLAFLSFPGVLPVFRFLRLTGFVVLVGLKCLELFWLLEIHICKPILLIFYYFLLSWIHTTFS